jgi:hypothetical protein
MPNWKYFTRAEFTKNEKQASLLHCCETYRSIKSFTERVTDVSNILLLLTFALVSNIGLFIKSIQQ